MIVHASCVVWQRHAVLIRGASGAGKSSLALQLMALGAQLVSDDRTCVFRDGAHLIAEAPEAIQGMIEARGVGILRARAVDTAPIALIVDLDIAETERLPRARSVDLLGQSRPLLHKVDSPHFPSAILQYLKAGSWEQM